MSDVGAPRTWLIRKQATLSEHPVDTPAASIVGPNTETVEVVERSALERAEEERDELADALEWLVRLKDGPRDDAYEHDKPLAWGFARAALSPSAPVLTDTDDEGGQHG